jgi:glycosyltransferase involved in cell wall biosynthesis
MRDADRPTSKPPARKRLLFLAPLPPPINGMSLASEFLLQDLQRRADVTIVDLADRGPGGRTARFRRLWHIISVLRRIRRGLAQAEIVYLTISQSMLGNLRDLAIYTLCGRKLNRVVVHLHGGAAMRTLLQEGMGWLRRLNRRFLHRVKAIVVLGDRHRDTFTGVAPASAVHVVPNFAADSLFVDDHLIEKKHGDGGRLRLLYLSNLLKGKGHEELLQAYAGLEPSERARLSLTFAGHFESECSRDAFLKKLGEFEHAEYCGVVTGETKRRLLASAHVFCLPTYYRYEGQPISILEAYASGCAVITTDHSGIGDVFRNRVNGYCVEKRSPDSLRAALRHVLDQRGELLPIARENHRLAEATFRTSMYLQSLAAILDV